MSRSSSDEFDDIREDNDPDEEFERKIQESYKIHKDTSRPTSSTSNRPLTATRHREEHDPRLALVTVPPSEVYESLRSNLLGQGLRPSALPRLLGEYLTSEAFIKSLASHGVDLSENEVIIIYRDHNINPRGGVLRTLDLVNTLEVKEIEEESKESNVPQKLLKEAEKLLEESQPRVNKQLKVKQKSDKSLNRPTSGSIRSGRSPNAMLRPFSAYTGKSKRTNNNTQRLPVDYLKMSKDKQNQADKELALTVDKCKKELEYDCLHKMGEANEIVQNMGLSMTYRAIKKDNGTTMCHIYENEAFVEEITLENFLREWRRLKRKQKPAINLPNGPSIAQVQPSVTSKVTTSAKVQKKERQEELKKLLLETKELTNKLKEQLKILEKKGIVSKSIHSSSAGYSTTFF